MSTSDTFDFALAACANGENALVIVDIRAVHRPTTTQAVPDARRTMMLPTVSATVVDILEGPSDVFGADVDIAPVAGHVKERRLSLLLSRDVGRGQWVLHPHSWTIVRETVAHM